jgi:outer membrane protein assembly factor BamA
LFVLLMSSATLLLVKTESGRGLLIDWASARLERAIGFSVQVDSSELRFFEGRLLLRGVTLQSVGDPEPFAQARTVDVSFRWRELFATPRRFEAVGVESFSVDPGHLPVPSAKGGGGPEPFPIRIEQLRWEAGEFGAWERPPGDSIWFERLSFIEVSGSGRLVDGFFEVDAGAALGQMEHPARPTIAPQIAFRGKLAMDGKVHDADADLRAEGLEGSVTVEELGPHSGAMQIQLAAEIGKIFSDLTTDGSANVEGLLEWEGADWRTSGEAKLVRLPAILLQPWVDEIVDPEQMRDRWLRADGRFDVELPAEAPDRIELDFDAALFDRDRIWIESAIHIQPRQIAGSGSSAEWQAVLLPGSSEQTDLSGRATIPDSSDNAVVNIEELEFRTEIEDLSRLVLELGLRESVFSEVRPVGGLRASAQLSGPINLLQGRGQLAWYQSSHRLLDLQLSSPNVQRSLSVSGSLLADDAGRRDFSGQLLADAKMGWSKPTLKECTAIVLLPDPFGAGEQIAGLYDVLRPHEPYPAWLEWLLLADPALDGELSLAARLLGRLEQPQVEAQFSWQPESDERLTLAFSGTFPLDDLSAGHFEALDLETKNLDASHLIALLPDELGGVLHSGQIDLRLLGDGPVLQPRALLRAEARNLSIASLPSMAALKLEMNADIRRWRVQDLEIEWEDRRFGIFSAHGDAKPELPLAEARFAVEQLGLVDVAAKVAAEFEMRDGYLELHDSKWTARDEIVGTLHGRWPLLPQWVGDGVVSSSGPGELEFDQFDLELIELVLGAENELQIAGKLTGSLSGDVDHVADTVSDLKIDRFHFQVGEERVDAVGQIAIKSRDRFFELLPGRLLAATSALTRTAPLDLLGSARLVESWRLGDDPTTLIDDIELIIDGTVDAALLAPIIDATGSGPVLLSLRAEGSPAALRADATLRGRGARVLISDPYPTRFDNLDVKVSAEGGTITIEKATADLNGGHADVSGRMTREDGLELTGKFERVRYRLDFGVTTWIDADLELIWPPTGTRELRGSSVVQRALLSRDLNLDREILRAIFDPVLDTGTSRELETVVLDLLVATDQGLIIRNNLAELRADWNLINIGGTLADPRLTGTAQVAPGGRLHLLGETLRIDSASLDWRNAPADQPVIQYETTSSREDPTIGQSWRSGWYTTDLGPGQGGALGFWGAANSTPESTLGSSLATYTQDRLYGSLANVLNRTELSYEPLPLFGETDTQARFTISQKISNQLSLIASTDPQQAEGQTYIVDLHAFRFAPSMRGQLFTGDNQTAGITLQQTITLGDDASSRLNGDPIVGKRLLILPEGLSRRALKRAIGFRSGDPFPSGSELDIEIDVAEAMRLAGYPDATVVVTTTPDAEGRLDIKVDVQAGPRVRFVFAGPAEIPRIVRQRLRATYQSGDDEPRALREMKEQGERALRATGCLEPILLLEPIEAQGAEQRRLRVESTCGRQVLIDELVFVGLPQEVGDWLAAGFRTQLSRVELAASVLDAEDHLHRTLKTIGYPAATIESRRISEDGTRLEVRVDPGERTRVREIQIEGADEVTLDHARGLMTIRAGDPLRRDWVDQSARALEADLRRRGYDRATVRSSVKEETADLTGAAVRFDVKMGRPAEVAQVKFEGLEHSKPRWVAKVAGLHAGEVLQRDQVASARGRLYRTGAFERIRVTTENLEREGESNESKPISLAFQLDEAPRYQLSYGGRWDSDVGLGGVVDLVNRHTLGRGHRTGVRAILNNELSSLRIYHRIPQPLRSERSSLLLFVESKRETIEDVESDVIEGWAQLTFPLTQRVQTRLYGVVGNRQILSGISSAEIPLEEQVISPRFGWQMAYTTVQSSFTNQRRRGVFFGVDLSGSHASLGADLTSFGLFSQFKVYAPFGRVENGRFAWHQSYRAGVLTARERAIPFVDRLRAGGEYSVRGYPTNSLGELDIDGNSLGGELMFVINQELHTRLWESLSGVLFFDAGNVWSSPDVFELDLFRSIGLGARYNSPIGPLRFDLGFPLDRRTSDDSYQLYIGFGSVF